MPAPAALVPSMVLAACLASTAPGQIAGDAAPDLLGACADEHLWIVAPAEGGTVHLLHHGRGSEPRVVSIQRTLSREPEALAAWGDRLWIVFPPEGPGPSSQRAVFTLESRFEPVLGAYRTEPPDRLGVVPPLPGAARLVGVAGSPDGLLALLKMAPPSPRRLPDAPGQDPDPGAVKLLELAGGSWRPVPIPEGLTRETTMRLLPPSSSGVGLTLLAQDGGDPARAYRRGLDGTWQPGPAGTDLDSIARLFRVGNLAAIARVDGGEYTISYLRPTGLIDLGRYASPPGWWTVLGTADALHEVSIAGGPLPERGPPAPEAVMLATIDPARGDRSEPQPISPPPAAAERMWHVSLLLAVAVTATLMVLILRPPGRGVSLPDDLQPLSAGARATSLLIDLAPGGLVALLLLGGSWRDLVQSPMWIFSAQIERAVPYIITVAICGLHTTVSEVVTRRTLGKAIVGARVVSRDGSRPGVLQMLARNGVKVLVLLVPPLVLLGLLNPNLQGIPDLVAGTVVVEAREAGAEDG